MPTLSHHALWRVNSKPPSAQLKAIVPNMEKTPNFVLQKELMKTVFNNNPRSQLVSSELLEKVSSGEPGKSIQIVLCQ